jgi:hypothetical protein
MQISKIISNCRSYYTEATARTSEQLKRIGERVDPSEERRTHRAVEGDAAGFRLWLLPIGGGSFVPDGVEEISFLFVEAGPVLSSDQQRSVPELFLTITRNYSG